MRVAIHQPNYVPWIGYFHKICACDVFVVLDSVQYTKNGFTNRNRIKTAQGTSWITIPVELPFGMHTLISQVLLRDDLCWRQKHLRTLQTNYGRAPHFSEVFGMVQSVLDRKETLLWVSNLQLIRACCEYLHIDTPIVLASDLSARGHKSDLLVSITKELGGDVYISGIGAQDYLSPDDFASHGIKVEYCSPPERRYPQLWGEFVPDLSVLDLLFNCGQEAYGIVAGGVASPKE